MIHVCPENKKWWLPYGIILLTLHTVRPVAVAMGTGAFRRCSLAETHFHSPVSCDSRPFLSSSSSVDPSLRSAAIRPFLKLSNTHWEEPEPGSRSFLFFFFQHWLFFRFMDSYIFFTVKKWNMSNEDGKPKENAVNQRENWWRPEGWWRFLEPGGGISGGLLSCERSHWETLRVYLDPDASRCSAGIWQWSSVSNCRQRKSSFYYRNVGPAGLKF